MSATTQRQIGRDPLAWARARTKWVPTTLLPESAGWRADVLLSTDPDADGAVRGVRIVPTDSSEPVEPSQTLVLLAASLEALREAAQAAESASTLPKELRDQVDHHIEAWGRRRPRNAEGAVELDKLVAVIAQWAATKGLSPRAVLVDVLGVSGPTAERWLRAATRP